MEIRPGNPASPAEPFRRALSHRGELLEKAARACAGVIGTACTYTPFELVHACGFVPIRLWERPGVVEKAYGLVPGFVCPFMRRCLEEALAGGFRFLSGIVQAYTCDVSCGVVNVWKNNFPLQLCRSLALPYNDGARSRSFLRSELMGLVDDLVAIGGTFSEDSLRRSVDLYGRIRSTLASVLDRLGRTGALGAAETLTLVQAFFVTPPETYLDMLVRLEDELPCGAPPDESRVPVIVSGSVLEDGAVLDLVEESGMRVVFLDLCTGMRALVPAAGAGEDPLESVVDRIMNRTACPSRSLPGQRARDLVLQAESYGARGVIFLFQKFCTPHLADLPVVMAALKDAGVPCMLVEIDGNGIEGQVLTRLETFATIAGAA